MISVFDTNPVIFPIMISKQNRIVTIEFRYLVRYSSFTSSKLMSVITVPLASLQSTPL